jgi:hypothetical protein
MIVYYIILYKIGLTPGGCSTVKVKVPLELTTKVLNGSRFIAVLVL